MKIELIDIDSKVLGRNVLSLQDLVVDDNFAAEEAAYQAQFQPIYVSCRVGMENLPLIHLLERNGFNFVECQIKSSIRFTRQHDVSRFPYQYQRVTSEEMLSSVLDIAGKTITHDRYTTDVNMAPGVSGTRYREYVLKSFNSASEEVWRLYDPVSGTTLAFRTHCHTAPGEVRLLLGGVHPDYKTLGLGVISSYYCFNQMLADGIRRATTHISAINYAVFNLEIGKLGFRVLETYAVMRKLYQ
ncbi:hypothetical protein [Microvirgula aerodenitrificans]|uniref:hypothetical protein n=1 Tax=Microvirgula aerodenitrificans TaxID=57480 RepID=UPI000491BAEF|nr:hypothetical protein [Microvirgula aerodenitrificans]